MWQQLFHIRSRHTPCAVAENGTRGVPTTLRTEILGGVTTFITMAYIIVLNPAILSHAKLEGEAELPLGAITVATILSAMVGTLLMGLYANRPLAVAPYMGENAFIAFGLAALQIGWAERI